MKALKIILIIPLFLPPTTEVSAETEIELKPMQIYRAIASFEHREEWDPWMPIAVNELTLEQGYSSMTGLKIFPRFF